MTATATAVVAPTAGRRFTFGAKVRVRATVESFVGQTVTSVPRYYLGQKPLSPLILAHHRPHADDGQPTEWPGSACTGSDSPFPAAGEQYRRWRRCPFDPKTPVRAVVLWVAYRNDGQWRHGRFHVQRQLELVQVALAPSLRPRLVLVDPADLLPGWGRQ